MNKQTAQKAAKWWADQLRGNAALDAKLDNPMAEGMAYFLQGIEKRKQTTTQIDKFETELASLISSENPWVISVDYHPDMILQDAANRAGLPLGMTTLPWKTTMWLEDDKVTVRCGYDAENEDLP